MKRIATPLLPAVVLALAACASKGPTQPPAQMPQADATPVKTQEATPAQRAKIRTELAAGYYERGRMDIALEELGNAKALDPTYPKIYDIYGLVYAMLGERAKAEENFQQAVSLAPDDSDIRENWGAYLCGTGRARESLPQFTQVLKDPLYKTPEIALINLGKCSAAIGDTKNAEEYLRRALTVSPGNPIAAYNLALLAYKDQRIGEARAWMRPVMQQASPPPQALYLGFCIERKHGDVEAAKAYASQLANRWPESTEAKSAAGNVCE
ncbi:MAG TPA: type IV pilus biogenesis/stability protein PilW [Casimicrobiaceae bacterium]|nr:type IV pilus biogenesis/stability protein PilW [Casimicrobiaceae bacterium]